VGLRPGDLPHGYRCFSVQPTEEPPGGADLVQQASWRWLPDGPASGSEPVVVDVSVAAYGTRTAAMRAVTSPPALPACMAIRSLFPPRIGDETAALRADAEENGCRYVLYRVDFQSDATVVTLAAIWRWPAGSPNWLYDRGRRMARRMLVAT
jgi:hypothetical protein